MVPGPCEGSYFHYGYNPERGICEQFKYGGCLGELVLRKLQMYYWAAPRKQQQVQNNRGVRRNVRWKRLQADAHRQMRAAHWTGSMVRYQPIFVFLQCSQIYISQSLFISMLSDIYQPIFVFFNALRYISANLCLVQCSQIYSSQSFVIVLFKCGEFYSLWIWQRDWDLWRVQLWWM